MMSSGTTAIKSILCLNVHPDGKQKTPWSCLRTHGSGRGRAGVSIDRPFCARYMQGPTATLVVSLGWAYMIW